MAELPHERQQLLREPAHALVRPEILVVMSITHIERKIWTDFVGFVHNQDLAAVHLCANKETGDDFKIPAGRARVDERICEVDDGELAGHKPGGLRGPMFLLVEKRL